ncbi:hypothetical integral membrane protein, DUF56 family [Plasmodium gonderi]|uniref:dolichol kinase n=1 Tax=Plasmodium gonderi TaxID=77519 RepID=A0A1Y1J9Y7_PLAGO|nr:hypothetical integral membrane protein, DUF56 family [Plasmodium gonderi]GAW79080.1 hypothetical integral membrane protein, DUF56 family [Plasmodium gonderi]
MIKVILILLIIATEVRRHILFSNYGTYVWIFMTILCSVLVAFCLVHKKGVDKEKERDESLSNGLRESLSNGLREILSNGLREILSNGRRESLSNGRRESLSNRTGERSIAGKRTCQQKGNLSFWNSLLTIGGYHHREKSPMFLNKTENNLFISLYEKGVLGRWHLFLHTYVMNLFSAFFFPFFSILLIEKYDILSNDMAKLSLVLVNEFILCSIFLRYVQVNLWVYLLFHWFLFLITLGSMEIRESMPICFLCFMINFGLYHTFSISVFQLTNGVFSFLEGITVSILGTLLLDGCIYGLFYMKLNENIVPNVVFTFFSKVAVSFALYATCCIYFIHRRNINKEKIIMSTLMFFSYNLFNLGSRQHDVLRDAETSALGILTHLIWNQKNYVLILLWLAVTTLYIFYIIKLLKKNENLSYLRKHYHFLLYLNVQLSFFSNMVNKNIQLLIITLSFGFLLLLLLEVIRKSVEALTPDPNPFNSFFTGFIDERDKKGLIVTHIYLLAGAYIPILTDVMLNKKNFIRRGNQSVYSFREVDLVLCSSGLSAICIGDSFAAIGGLLFPNPKMKNTNNKSYAGFLFFFCSTFLSLWLERYLFQKGEHLTGLTSIFMTAIFGALFEAYLYDIDNLILPIFTFCVPSDIAILEHKYAKKNEKRRINLLKRIFIHFSFFKIGNNCNKLNSYDVIKVLSNVYADEPNENKNLNSVNILNILNTRQRDIEKQVKCKMYSFIGCLLLPLYSLNKFRYYDAKSKIIIVPFFSIAGIYLGSFVGNLATGRFSDYKRSKFLGTLPANVFLKE